MTTREAAAKAVLASPKYRYVDPGLVDKLCEQAAGRKDCVKVVKNKLAPPFRQVEFDIMYGEGVSKVGELIDLGVKVSVVEKSGAWFSYDSQRIGQGRENAKAFLRDHKEIALALEAKIREQSGLVTNAMLATLDEAEEAEAAE